MSTWRLCWRFSKMALRRWRPLLGVIATMLMTTALTALQPWPMKVLVDDVLNGHRTDLLDLTVAATLIIFLLNWLVGVAEQYANINFGQRLVYDLAGQLFDHLQKMSLRFHSRRGTGDSIRRIMTDAGSISTIVGSALLPVVSSVFTLVTMLSIMWVLDPSLTLLALAAIPFMVVALVRYSKPMEKRSYEQHTVEGELYNVVEETLSAVAVVQAFEGEARADARMRRTTDAALRANYAATWVQFKFKLLVGFGAAVGTAIVMYVGGRQALDDHLTVGTILVFLTYLASMYGPIQSLVYTSSTIQDAAGSGRRVLEVLEAEHEVGDRVGAVELGGGGGVRGHVRLEDVRFAYEPGREVLRGVSVEAAPGEQVAIVGATGAGKSTLVSLVPRFFDPSAGRVLVDGVDVREVRLSSLRRQVSLVLQESFLFPVSIAENIAYGRPDASRVEVEAAARAANAHVFVERLADGYDTIVGERGATLSGGERQRVAIARALLKDAPILILDEPTSALDAQTEALLLEALERLMEGRTTLIIAHRLSTIRNADRIVVLDDGRVVECGTHDELLAADSHYAHLQHLQTTGARG